MKDGHSQIPLPLPTYVEVLDMERNLPQHSLSLPFPEGKTGRYVKFSNQIYMLGWNNVLAEILLCSHLARRSNRAYVFQDYAWNPEHFPWKFDGVPYTPLNALMAGPTVGGPWNINDKSPRAISSRWFDKVCPPEERTIIRASDAKDPIRGKDAKTTMDYWAKILEDMPDRCVEFVNGDMEKDHWPQTFDLWTISNENALSIWEEFSTSPVSRLLRTSTVVNSAIYENEGLFFPQKIFSSLSWVRYDGMLAVHLRRGDYIGACENFANWNSSFFMWNLLPGLPDPLRRGPPVGEGTFGKNTPENYDMYGRRCLPTQEQLIERIHNVKNDWESGSFMRPNLKSLYIMTNAKDDWLQPLITALKSKGWESIVTSRDLVLDPEQTATGMAIDMDIGRRAAVFIGNGWSSLTSNVVHRRLVDGRSYESCRFL
ncbi:hypothetical protein M422DRAFT_154220 [Sphaerobolus stellatus SS14]|nr:hypothetical protein M422DRAFT_154220 [Sphaerobolus stellatus SS14]